MQVAAERHEITRADLVGFLVSFGLRVAGALLLLVAYLAVLLGLLALT